MCGNVRIDTFKREVKLQFVVGNVNKFRKIKKTTLGTKQIICLVLSQS